MYMKIRKLILHQVFIERSKRRTCSLLKESHKKKKKKKKGGGGGGTPAFWLGLLLFIKRESQTPTFKTLVRTLQYMYKGFLAKHL